MVTADGTEREVDVIVYATGYETTRYISALDITGRDGLDLRPSTMDAPPSCAMRRSCCATGLRSSFSYAASPSMNIFATSKPLCWLIS